MSWRTVLALAFGVLIGLAVVTAFRFHYPFTEPPEWVYGFAAGIGAAAAIGVTLVASRPRRG